MKTFVIGDIHGGNKGLIQVLQKAPVTKNDRLIFMGDYADGWSGSFEVIETLIGLKNYLDCIFLCGNHDVWVRDWLRMGARPKVWLEHGGLATIKSYENASSEAIRSHLNFYDALEPYHIDTKNRCFVHGGYTNEKGVAAEKDALTLYTDRTLWKLALQIDAGDESINNNKLNSRMYCYRHIFIGHTPTLRIHKTTPVTATNITNVDTGAAFSGKLSMMNVDTREFWQSDVLQDLYPEEEGRN